MKARDVLLGFLTDGARTLEDCRRHLTQSRQLGFGVEPDDVVSACLTEGLIVTFSDGMKAWARKGAPFVQLQRGNDWGVNYIAYDPLKDGKANARRAINATEGQVVEIRWPDGSITNEPLVMKTSDETIFDHGHSANVSSILPGVKITMRGIFAWIPLDTPGLKVRADAFG